MDIKFINKILREEAVRKGLCLQWQREWRNVWDADKLIEKYKEGIDFCLLNDYPSVDFIVRYFDRDFLRKNDILANDSYSLLNPRIAVLLGESKAVVRYNAWNPGTVYVCGNSSLDVTAKGNAFVLVHAFGGSRIKASSVQRSKIVVLRHSEDVVVELQDGNVQVRDELNYLKDN